MCEGSVLLETAKFDAENYRSLLFTEPGRQLVGWTPKDACAVFAEVDHHLQQGSFVAGFVSYECGEALQGIAPRPLQARCAVPLIAMGVFTAPTIFDHSTGQVQGGAPTLSEHSRQAAAVVQTGLQITAAAYEQQIRRIQDYLAAGHSYQVNFTDKVQGTFTGSHLDLYQTVLARQPVPYAAFVNLGGQQVLSFSPELFYRVQDGSIRVRPMKGTWPRGRNTAEDEYAARSLKIDEKNRAEHITIVDLLRNDLGKVCELGSVQVDALMRVERYRTLHQMTSDISGRLLPHVRPAGLFQNIFPSGSITGAPKRRTMEIIQETERAARGVYTGAIGYFTPQNEACFNVAIRTLLVQGTTFTLGVGGGVTLDSTPSGEYAECKLKAAFLTQSEPKFHLFETMRAAGGSVPRLASHLQRMRDSAMYFGVHFDEDAIRRDLTAALSGHAHADGRVRLVLKLNGEWRIAISPLEQIRWSGKVLLWPEPVQSSDAFLQHKTSHRELYRHALTQAQRQGYDEVIFQNERGMLTEGSISNLFARLPRSAITPDVSCGLLAGVERAHLLRSCPDIQVGALTLEDLVAAHELWLTNALRGSRAIQSVHNVDGKVIAR